MFPLCKYVKRIILTLFLCVMCSLAQAAVPPNPGSSPSSTHYHPQINQLYRITYPRAANTMAYQVYEKAGYSGNWKLKKHSSDLYAGFRHSQRGVYFYRYRHVNLDGKSGFSSPMQVTVGSAPSSPSSAPTTRPSNKAMRRGTYDVRWLRDSSTDNYDLYQSGHSQSSWDRLYYGSRTSKQLTNTVAANYYYKHRQCNALGCSGYGPTKHIYVYDTPAAITDFRTNATSIDVDTTITLKWTRANGMAGGPGYYAIDRTSPTGAVDRFTVANVTNTNNTYQDNANAGPGVYTYTLTPCNDNLCASSSSLTVEAKTVSQSPVANAGDTVHMVDSHSNRTLTGSATDADSPEAELTYLWEQISGTSVAQWTNKDKKTTTFKTPNVTGSQTLTFRFTVTDAQGNENSDAVDVILNDRPTLKVDLPVSHHKRFKSDELLTIEVSNVKDLDDGIAYVSTFIRQESNKVKVVNSRTFQLTPNTTAGSYTYPPFTELGLQPNTEYRVVAYPMDDHPQAPASGTWGNRLFKVNAKPKIIGAVSKSTSVSESLTITLADLNITDSDDATHTISILPSSHYSVNDNDVQFNDTTVSGVYDIKVTVNDGIESSEPYLIQATVTGQTAITPDWLATGGDVASSDIQDVDRPDGEIAFGSVQAQASVSGGAANYTLPIAVPIGRANMQPNVSVNYSSRAGEGLAGVGFSLNATTSISRCPKIFAIDDMAGGVTFSDSDKLCLNGARLIVISGQYGANGSTYKTEQDDLSIVKQLGGSLASSKAYFTIAYPNGHKASFGLNNANSKYATNPDAVFPYGVALPLSWFISNTVDVTGNNKIDYQYLDKGKGEVLLDSIYYTGTSQQRGSRSVKFHYENRVNTTTSFIRGGEILRTQRLKKIATQLAEDNDNNTIREYTFSYVDNGSAATQRDLLKRIDVCAEAKEDCYEPTVLSWHQSPVHYQVEMLSTNNDHAIVDVDQYVPNLVEHLPRGDIDGNGSRDWPDAFINAQGDKVGDNLYSLSACFQNPITFQAQCLDGDFNLDGKTDSWAVVEDEIHIHYTANQTSNHVNTQISVTEDYNIEAISDFNGDGWPDILVYEATCTGQNVCSFGGPLVLYAHTTDPDSPYLENGITLYSLESNQTVSVAGDLDGNGILDLGISTQKPNQAQPMLNEIVYILPTAQGNITAHVVPFDIVQNHLQVFSMLLDVNADGLNDWIGWTQDTGTSLQVRLNKGDGSFAPVVDTQVMLDTIEVYLPGRDGFEPDYPIVPAFVEAFKQMDVNGDGTTELIFPSSAPDDIVISYCREYQRTGGSGQSELVTKCGADIRTPDKTYVNGFEVQQAPDTRLDANIYKYAGVSFSVDKQGAISASLLSTENVNIIASANNAFVVDALGKGLQDVIFGSGCVDSGCYIAPNQDLSIGGVSDTHNQVLFNRNYGSVLSGEPTKHDYMPVDLLRSIDNGFGIVSHWHYRPLSASHPDDEGRALYQVDSDNVVDDQHHLFGSSMYVVSSFSQSNGIGGANEQQYQYKNAMYNTQGRGFRGFEAISVIDVARDIETQTTFLQKFPYSSLIQRQESRQSSTQNLITQSDYSYQQNVAHDIDGVSMLVQLSATVSQFDVNTDDTLLSSQINTVNMSDVDAYGNIRVKTTQMTVFDDAENSINYTHVDTKVFDASHTFEENWPRKVTTTHMHSTSDIGSNLGDISAEQNTTKNATTSTTYDTATRLPARLVNAAGNETMSYEECIATPTPYCSVQEYTYNAYGLLKSTSVGAFSGVGHGTAEMEKASWQTRDTSFTYSENGNTASAQGYFPFKQTRSVLGVNHQVETHHLPGIDKVVYVKDATSNVTQYEYDKLGRLLKTSATGIPAIYTDYRAPKNDHTGRAKIQIVTSQAGAPQSSVYIDSLGRTVLTEMQGFDGNWVYNRTNFDSLGRATQISVPYKNSAIYNTYRYDLLDRVIKKTSLATDGGTEQSVTNYSYNGLTTNIIVKGPDATFDGDLEMSRRYGVKGELLYTLDAVGGRTDYSYDGSGNPLIIRDANDNTIAAAYDDNSRKVWVSDPNQGITKFTYNGFGEIEKERDANLANRIYHYDSLGRMTRRESDSQVATFFFDSHATSSCAVGLLCRQSITSTGTGNNADGGSTTVYDYDSLARLTATDKTIEGASYKVIQTYDANYGRPLSLTYPNQVVVGYQYNERGYLTREFNAQSDYEYQRITSQDVRGNATSRALGNNNMVSTRSYSWRTGQMLSSRVTQGANQYIQDIMYSDYDSFGNIKTQVNNLSTMAAQENFVYDRLQRLTQSSLEAGGLNNTLTYGYDKVGNLRFKSDYSVSDDNAYQYADNTNRLSGVTLANGTDVTFGYDNKGNQTHRGQNQQVWFNTHNKPTRINKLGQNIAFYYGADGMRYKQVRQTNGDSASKITTHYIDTLFEVETSTSGTTLISYISDIAIIRQNQTTGNTIRYTHKDRLGSTSTFSDEFGNVTGYRSYDPFGKPKGGDWSSITRLNLPSRLSNNPLDEEMATRRGFTDHEHLDEVELIHMNGRVYDYNIGRFLSVDPFIQEAGNSQSVNPYSYVMNNPLSFTDPTGYIGSRIKDSEGEERDTLAGVKGVTSKNRRGGYDATKANAAFNGASVGTPKNSDSQQTVDIQGESTKNKAVTTLGGKDASVQQQTTDERYSLPANLRATLVEEIDEAIEKHDLIRFFKGDTAEEDAAFAWANAINPISNKYNVELGARIFEDRDDPGSFRLGNTITDYNNSNISDMRLSQISNPSQFRYRAFIHTHGKGNRDGSSEFFSGRNNTKIRSQWRGDLVVAGKLFSNAYLATPNGELKKFTFSNWDYRNGKKAHTAVTTIGIINN